MTARQDHIDAMNKYVKLSDEYGTYFHQMSEPGGLSLSEEGLNRFIEAGDEAEAARQEYVRTLRVWIESGEN